MLLAYSLAPEENLAVVMNRPREAPLPESAPTNAWMSGLVTVRDGSHLFA